jgi:ABC-type antimicrobial peptide transport system permease subunit
MRFPALAYVLHGAGPARSRSQETSLYFRFLARELRRRSRSAAVVAIGLAVGVGLVVTVTAAAAGVKTAQGEVLHSLYGVGTDISVTEPATPGSGGGFHFGGGPTTRAQAGTPFSTDHLSSSSGLGTFSSKTITSISKEKGVSGAAGALTLVSLHVTGTFPSFSGSSGAAAPSVAPFSVNSYTIDGIQINSPGLGPLSSSKITSGAYFTSAQSDKAVALVDATFAKEKGLKVGSSWTIGSTTFKVIGIVTPSATSSGADVYIPLKEAQTVAGDGGKINTVYVSAASASDISTVQSEIQHLVPKATVTTAQDLADQVSGSLTTAANLVNSLGIWLAVAVLLAAFVLAALLTLASVARRGRDFGTLKALGWHSRRIVGQVVGESLVQGLVGGAVGLVLGLGGAALVTKLAPKLDATVGATPVGTAPGASFFGGGRGFGGSGTGSHTPFHHPGGAIDPTRTVPLHLTAPIQPEWLLLAVGLAVAGGLIAGILGGWRVSRLRPAEALRRVE